MKKVMAFIILLMFTVSPIVRACMTPADSYAVEVVLNKPGIGYNLWRFEAAHHVIFENGTFIFRSHYDERLYVLIWNASDGLHLRIEIPVRLETVDVSRASLTIPLVITDEAIERLRADGWNSKNLTTFERNGVRISLLTLSGGECTSDSECATGGCSGEVCAPKDEAGKIVTPCIYKAWYKCLSLTSCGCLNGTCTWKPNPAFEACLKEHGVDPGKVIRGGYVRLEVEGVNKSDDEVEASVKDFLGAFGISCNTPLTFVKTSITRFSPSVSPSEVNASEAIRTELEWLIDGGVIKMNEGDVDEITKAAEWGFAGYNSKIGWYETKNGSYAWIPYHESKDPLLVKCFSRIVSEHTLPNGTAYFGPTSTPSPTGSQESSEGTPSVCGPGLVLGLAVLLLLWRR